MKTNLTWRRLVILSLGVALLGVPGYSSISEILAVGTIPHSELFDGPATVTVRKLTIEPGEILAWHHHPGRAYNVILSGTLTAEDGCGGEEVLTPESHSRRSADASTEPRILAPSASWL